MKKISTQLALITALCFFNATLSAASSAKSKKTSIEQQIIKKALDENTTDHLAPFMKNGQLVTDQSVLDEYLEKAIYTKAPAVTALLIESKANIYKKIDRNGTTPLLLAWKRLKPIYACHQYCLTNKKPTKPLAEKLQKPCEVIGLLLDTGVGDFYSDEDLVFMDINEKWFKQMLQKSKDRRTDRFKEIIARHTGLHKTATLIAEYAGNPLIDNPEIKRLADQEQIPPASDDDDDEEALEKSLSNQD
jgi:hypothetical protein